MCSIPAQTLHYVLRIADRGKNLLFFRDVLGMKVLRHEEFKEGCAASCNGPFANRWSKTMVGYGPEDQYFAVELTYNYGITSYEMGNEFNHITIVSKEALKRACLNDYPVTMENSYYVLTSPDGYKFYVVAEQQPTDIDPIVEVCLNSTDLHATKAYWNELLGMELRSEGPKFMVFCYGDYQVYLRFRQITGAINRTEASGRIAFSVPRALQPSIRDIISAANHAIVKPLMKLDTPGKASVRVIILADPDGHEICFVDREGFTELSQMDPDAYKILDRHIARDPYQEKSVKLERRNGPCSYQ